MYCKLPIILAYSMLTYIIASIVYLLVTLNYGTPFKDELKKYPDLQRIQKESSNKRRKTFLIGILIAILILIILKPFKKCKSYF